MRKSKADHTVEGIFVILLNISKGTAVFLKAQVDGSMVSANQR